MRLLVHTSLLLGALLAETLNARAEPPPSSRGSLAGTPSDAGFASAEQAFEAAFVASGVARQGYEENREYAAALYQMPDGRWHSTEVATGGRTSSWIPYGRVPADATRIVGAHTHGGPTLPEDPSRIYGTDFSQVDRRNALEAYRVTRGRIDTQLLLTSRLEVLRMTIRLHYDVAKASITLDTETTRIGGPLGASASAQTQGSARVDSGPTTASAD